MFYSALNSKIAKTIFFTLVPLLLLTGCKTTLTTTIESNGVKANGFFELVMSGESAEILLDNPKMDQEIYDLLIKKSGGIVERKVEKNSIIYRSALNEENDIMTPLTGVTIKKNFRSGNITTIQTTLQSPSELLLALESSVEGSTDASAQLLVLERLITICSQIVFKGSITEVSKSGPITITQNKNKILACSTIEELKNAEGNLEVKGIRTTSNIYYLIILPAVVIIYYFYRRRLRR